jgi:hypothetical protein
MSKTAVWEQNLKLCATTVETSILIIKNIQEQLIVWYIIFISKT